MNSDKCKSCGAAIRWVRILSSRTGKSSAMPINPNPAMNGNIIVEGDDKATVLSNSAADEVRRAAMQDGDPGGIPLFLSHFATCPNAARHRSKS